MKHSLILLIAAQLCLENVCSSQEYRYVYYFDEDLKNTNRSKAAVIGKGLKEDDIFRLDFFMKKGGPPFLTAHYLDSSLKTMYGRYATFYRSGVVETQGNYLNDKKHGLWEKWDSLGRKTDSTIYQEDKVVSKASFGHYDNGRLSYYSVTDSLADTFSSISYDDKGMIKREVAFKGQLGMLKTYDSGSVKLDSLYTREAREASFPGGQKAWMTYLYNHVDPDIPVRNGAPPGTYQVIVNFIIGIDGIITNAKAETQYGYGMESALLKALINAPRWEPASQYGRKVLAYRRQPITFFVEQR